jgi:hypothetical protein
MLNKPADTTLQELIQGQDTKVVLALILDHFKRLVAYYESEHNAARHGSGSAYYYTGIAEGLSEAHALLVKYGPALTEKGSS